MQFSKFTFAISTMVFLSSCSGNENQNLPLLETDSIVETGTNSLSAADQLIAETIEAHGGDLYKTANYSFVFRENTFQFKNDGAKYEYSKTYEKEGAVVKDLLRNETFSRTINGELVELTDEQKENGGEGINSVIYFATLPYKLSDKAVNAKQKESISIKGKKYDVIEISFDQAGGGEDFDDKYYYWINESTHKIDYFAYNYSTNNGGVRFRSAFNTAVVDGITFQDYVNYEAKVGTPLKDLPLLYEKGKLIEVSKIKTEKLINLNNK